MTLAEISEWRGWIWIALFLLITGTGAGFSLYARAEQYTDRRVDELRDLLRQDLGEIRQDLRTIQDDVKRLLDRR